MFAEIETLLRPFEAAA